MGYTPLICESAIISDIHFGKKSANLPELLEFLSVLQCQNLFVVGDLFDGWKYLKRKDAKPYTEAELMVLDYLNALAASGVNVVILPGNHDEKLRLPALLERGELSFVHPVTHQPISFSLTDRFRHSDGAGNRTELFHGDQVEPDHMKSEFWRALGKGVDPFYDAARLLDRQLESFRALLPEKWKGKKKGKPFSFAKHAKTFGKNFAGVITEFNRAVAVALEEQGLDGILCGHFHDPYVREINGKTVFNSGDWVESNSFVTVSGQGQWSLHYWDEERAEHGFYGSPVLPSNGDVSLFRPLSVQQAFQIANFWPCRKLARLQEEGLKAGLDLSAFEIKYENGRGEVKVLQSVREGRLARLATQAEATLNAMIPRVSA